MPSTLVDANNKRTEFPDRQVDSVCPYCGVGCQLTYNIKDDKLLYVTGKEGPANENRLCVKGRFGFDYVHNKQRLTQPMIRKDGVPKIPHEIHRSGQSVDAFPSRHLGRGARPAAAGFLKTIRDRDGPGRSPALARPNAPTKRPICSRSWCAPASAPTMSIIARGFAMPPRSRRLLEGVGSAAVSATFNEVKNSDVIVVIGANPTENHPVAATYFKQAAKRGAKLIVMDPRGQALKRHAGNMMQFKNGTDVAMLNAMLNVIVEENLYDKQYVQTYVEGFEALRRAHQGFHAGGDGADLRHRGRCAARGRAHLRARRERHHLLGHGRVAAHPRHRQCALPDRAVADHRPDRPARHRPASAARPEQRAGRLRRRPDPDVLSRLQVGGESRNRAAHEKNGACSSIPSAG